MICPVCEELDKEVELERTLVEDDGWDWSGDHHITNAVGYVYDCPECGYESELDSDRY